MCQIVAVTLRYVVCLCIVSAHFVRRSGSCRLLTGRLHCINTVTELYRKTVKLSVMGKS